MKAPVTNGILTFTETSRQGTGNTKTNTSTRVYQGTNPAEFVTLYNNLIALGTNVSYETGSVWTITSNGSFDVVNNPSSPDQVPDQEPQASFSISSNRVTTDLLQSVNPLVLTLAPETVRALQKAIKDGTVPNDILRSGAKIGSHTLTAQEQANAATVYMIYLNGEKTYTFHSQKLRKHYYASPTWNIRRELDYVDRIYSTSTLIAIEQIPLNLQNGLLPSYSYEKTVMLPGNTGTARLIWYAGWKKGAIDYNVIGTSNVEVSVEYEYGIYLNYTNQGTL
jgi:hypothetical protein